MQKPPVSIIIPTCNRYPVVLENIRNINLQKYPDFEIIVADDTHIQITQENQQQIEEIKAQKNVRYFQVSLYDHCGNKTYGLAHARNFGAVEARGSVLIFLDDRITPDTPLFLSIMVEQIIKCPERKVWFFGEKGGHKDTFVENCSAIWREHFIVAGMFCEQIPQYGGLTKETYARFRRQGFNFVYVPQALAKPLKGGTAAEKMQKQKSAIKMMHYLKKIGC